MCHLLVLGAVGSTCALSNSSLAEVQIAGKTFFDLFDFVSSNVLMPLGGIFLCLFVGWVWGFERMKTALTKRAEALTGDIRSLLREKNVRHAGIVREGNAVDIRFRDAATAPQGWGRSCLSFVGGCPCSAARGVPSPAEPDDGGLTSRRRGGERGAGGHSFGDRP